MADFELSSPKRLGRTVVLGYCDIAAAGIRVLEGMSAPSGEETAGIRETGRESLTFSGAGAAIFDGIPALEAVHFDGGGGTSDNQSVTLLKLNTAVGRDLSASLSLSIVGLLDAHRSTLGRVIIAAAVQPPKRHQIPPAATAPSSTAMTSSQTQTAFKTASFPPDTVCAFSCDGHSGGGSGRGDGDASRPSPPVLPASTCNLPPLPAGVRIADSFLTTLVRLCSLEELPLLLLARLGYRATGAAADVDGTDEAINGLGQCLEQVIGLKFDGEKACGARRSKGWKGTSPSQGVVPGYI